METIFDEYLGDLINLTPIKILPGANKKVITSSIFIPEKPNISDKTYSYFTGLIKSIEVFSERMPKGWIYRLYVDELFIKGLKFKEDKTIEKSIYNSISSDSDKDPFRKLTKKNIIKRKLRRHKDNLKKVQHLMYLYIQKIIDSKDKKYKNIELLSFKCSEASETNKYPGHSSTFGSIIRFFTLFDSDIDLFISFNCRYPINKLLKEIIMEFDGDDKKKILAYKYETSFLRNVTYKNLFLPFFEIKNKESELSTEGQTHFKECVNQMLDTREEIIDEKMGLNFDKMKTYKKSIKMFGLDPLLFGGDRKGKMSIKTGFEYSVAAGLFGMKREAMFNQRIEVFANYLRYLILSGNDFNFGIDEIILKMILAPEVVTMNLYYDYDDDKLKIDYMGKEKDIDYIYFLFPERNHFIPDNLFDREKSFLTDENKKKIIFDDYLGEPIDEDMVTDGKQTLTDFILFEGLSGLDTKSDLLDIHVFGARSLFVNHKTKPIKESDKLYRIFERYRPTFQDLDFSINYLFAAYDEYKKLFIFDSEGMNELYQNIPSYLRLLNNFTDINNFFVFKDIQEYSLDNMGQLLGEIIEHYGNLKEPELLEGKNSSNKTVNVSGGPAGKTKKKRGKGLKKTEKKRKN